MRGCVSGFLCERLPGLCVSHDASVLKEKELRIRLCPGRSLEEPRGTKLVSISEWLAFKVPETMGLRGTFTSQQLPEDEGRCQGLSSTVQLAHVNTLQSWLDMRFRLANAGMKVIPYFSEIWAEKLESIPCQLRTQPFSLSSHRKTLARLLDLNVDVY